MNIILYFYKLLKPELIYIREIIIKLKYLFKPCNINNVYKINYDY